MVLGLFRRKKKEIKEEKEQTEAKENLSNYECVVCGKLIPEDQLRVKKFNRQKYYFHKKCWREIKRNPWKFL